MFFGVGRLFCLIKLMGDQKNLPQQKKFDRLGLVFTLLGLIFAGSVLLASLWKASAQNTIKSDQYQLTVDYQEQVDPKEPEVDYFLAYPGLLPDHPLYPFKVLRDRLWLFLTFSQTGKVEKQLLFADKRIFAALQLMEKNRPGEALATVIKAEYYLLAAAQRAEKIDNDKGGALRQKINQASLKHREILELLQAGIDGGGGEISRSLEINSQARSVVQ